MYQPNQEEFQTMLKRIISLAICLIIVVSAFAGCSAKLEDSDKGAYISMYLTDMVYDLDPANAFANESTLKIVSLLYDNLFVIGENGKLEYSLAESYKITKNEELGEYKMIITLNKAAKWSDNIAVTANDVVYAWKRVLDNEASYDAACLLFDIKNAREAKEADASIDDVAVYALNENEISVEFVGDIDYDQFLRNISSYALVPLREDIVSRAGDDWAKRPSTMVTSGPFKLRTAKYDPDMEKGEIVAISQMIIERNPYYYRNYTEDAYDKSVKPYQLRINYSMTDEEIMAAYENGEIFYVGDIPLSVRNSYADKATVTDAPSTHTYVLNENAVIRKYDRGAFSELESNRNVFNKELVAGVDGDKIFADAKVRQALSLAIDREAIANAVVFAKAASGLVPYTVKDTTNKKADTFRAIGGDIIAPKADLEAAKALLKEAGVKASDYMFAISVAAYDDVHMQIASMVAAAWNELGFHVAVNAIDAIDNDEISKITQEADRTIKDDVFAEAYRAAEFEVAAIDMVSLVNDAYSLLAPFAKAFSGQAMDMTNLSYELTPNKTGYDVEAYNELMEKVLVAKTQAEKAELLHEAEKMLMEDMPVIPVIFNQNAVLVSDELSKVEFTTMGTPFFTDTKLKDYELYIPEEEKETELVIEE